MFLSKQIFLIISFLLCIQGIGAEHKRMANGNPSHYVSHAVWKQVKEHLMPHDHPIKHQLDHIFSNSRALCDRNSMEAAGFSPSLPRHHNQMIVATHPKLKGYLIKAYLDDQEYFEDKPEHYFWIRRIKGAELIRKFIKTHQYEHFFKVPKKWIYLLPDQPSPPSHYLRKMFILVVEDMEIFDDKANEAIWGSDWVTQELLNAFYEITTELGLNDTPKPDNCPFSIDGRVAFIDTELYHHSRSRIKYYRLTPYLSPPMQEYWKQLIQGKDQ